MLKDSNDIICGINRLDEEKIISVFQRSSMPHQIQDPTTPSEYLGESSRIKLIK